MNVAAGRHVHGPDKLAEEGLSRSFRILPVRSSSLLVSSSFLSNFLSFSSFQFLFFFLLGGNSSRLGDLRKRGEELTFPNLNI